MSSGCVVVTGGSGFLGTQVCQALRKQGQGCWSTIVAMGSSDYNLLNMTSVTAMFARWKPRVVIHLAAVVGGIGANMREPGRFAYENMQMGMNVLEAARMFRDICCEKLVLAGTICMYPKFTKVPFKEEDIWLNYPEPTNAPYGMAKTMLFVMADAYRAQYGVKSVCLLPVNLYGPEDKSDHVIPDLMAKLAGAKFRKAPSVTLWGDGSPTREFLYRDDCARAFAIAAKDYDGGEWINLGSGKEITISELAYKIKRLVGYEGDILWDKTKPNGQPRRCLDTSRAKRLLGWEATTGFDDGLQKMWQWYSTKDFCNKV